ncbi:hypothetical protein FGO68_gene11034 [Halteria grandinella]|uniref:Uncharacterized protein n=1 Tax=Halteria grandinella TaxID=5974 RepID=A0A8J8NRZ1_HALGN|nr:hypothetical protein FGO68_gene11034 [Halteria grandinella]
MGSIRAFQFGINEKCAGYLLIGQVVSSGIANIIQKKESPKESRIYMSLSFMINFIGCIWIGPSWILQIPQYESLFLAGILLLGLGQIPILAYSQIEIVKAVHMQTGINLEEVPLSTYARSYISISQTIGFIIGPLIGISGGLPLICDSLALVSLLFGFLYFMLSVLYFSDSEGFGVNSSYYCTLSQNDQLRPDEEKALKELPLGQEIENTSERAKECVLVRRSSWDGVKASTPLPVEVSQSRNDSTSSAGEDELHFEENNKKLVFISALKADKNSSTVVIRNRIQSMDANVPRQDKVESKLFKQYSRSKVEDLFNKVRE